MCIRYATNKQRVINRKEVYELLTAVTKKKTAKEWLDGLEKLGVPAGAVNNVKQVFEDPQIQHREMQVTIPYPGSADGKVKLIGNPLKLSGTPVTYRRHPPKMGEHTDEVLREFGLGADEIPQLRKDSTI